VRFIKLENVTRKWTVNLPKVNKLFQVTQLLKVFVNAELREPCSRHGVVGAETFVLNFMKSFTQCFYVKVTLM